MSLPSAALALALALLLGACASPAPGPKEAGATGEAGRAALACTLASNCVSSIGDSDPAPLRFAGTTAEARSALEATLATYPEARIVRSEGALVAVIFTTTVGFKDQVDFRIDSQAQRIDFRSRSLFGLFDFGKNRSRMQEFADRFAQKTRR